MTEQAFYDLLLIAAFASAVIVAPVLLLVTAPYGRHDRAGWGPRIDATLAWVAMEAPAPLLYALFFLLGDRTRNLPAVIFFLLFELHYLYRAFVFPFRRRGAGRRIPVAVAGSALLFNLLNGYLQGRGLNGIEPVRPPLWLRDPRFLAGAALFLAGLAINFGSDGILLRLRKPGGTGYAIPRGGLFRWVSCPNYLGEILEWAGWAIATWSLPGLAFAVWTAANLVPRALSHHRWYRATFPGYPPGRRALIPLIL